jgi:hypothetical protein
LFIDDEFHPHYFSTLGQLPQYSFAIEFFVVALTLGQYASMLFRSSVEPHSIFPHSESGVFLRRALPHAVDYYANIAFSRASLAIPTSLLTSGVLPVGNTPE